MIAYTLSECVRTGMRIGRTMMEHSTPYLWPTLVFQLNIQAILLGMIQSANPCSQEYG
jgi:hypothetical protein